MTQNIIAFDPGVTTGIVLYSEDEYTLAEVVGLRSVWDILHEVEPQTIIFEKFFYQRRDKVDLTPVEVIGVIRLYAHLTNTLLWGQSPQEAKRFWTDDKIKRMGLWEPGKRHATDALRHILHFQVFKLNDTSILERLRSD
jgi:hypothetical protein